jgi:hypothetical protein
VIRLRYDLVEKPQQNNKHPPDGDLKVSTYFILSSRIIYGLSDVNDSISYTTEVLGCAYFIHYIFYRKQ